MPIDFPSGPTTGQVYTYLGKSWVYNGTAWDAPKALSEIGAVQTFANAAARTAAIPTPTEGIVSYLNDVNLLQTNNGSAWVTTGNAGVNAYNFVQTLYYTSSGTFTKATYPWLRAIRVKVQGAGGGGSGAPATGAGQVSGGGGGGGGGYAEKFITDIAELSSSITVTVGAGGAGGIGNASGANAGSSIFDSVTGGGGGGGEVGNVAAPIDIYGNGGSGGNGSGGDLNIRGSGGSYFFAPQAFRLYRGGGGGSQLGGSTQMTVAGSASAGDTGLSFGGGGFSAVNSPSQGAKIGGAGAPGIVIVELYA
jgi:hypothetical protein